MKSHGKEIIANAHKKNEAKKKALEGKKLKNPFKGEEGEKFSKKQDNLRGKNVNQ